MICKNCNSELEKNTDLCGKCGAPVPKKSKAPILVSLIAGVAILAVIAILLIMNFPTDAYEKQIDIGYDLLEKGDYEEAVIAFDKAIKIDEKRPEGYMGKAESMAHDPKMTPEKAGEIVRVLEEGYKKSGDKKVLEHKTVVGKIIRKNGFEAEAQIVENTTSSAPHEENAKGKMTVGEALAFGNRHIFIGTDGLAVKDGDKEEIIFEGKLNSLMSDGETAYVIDEEKRALYKVDINSGESLLLDESEQGKDGGLLYKITGFAGGKIYIAEASDLYMSYTCVIDPENGERTKTELPWLWKIHDFNGKIYAEVTDDFVSGYTAIIEADYLGENMNVIIEYAVTGSTAFYGDTMYYSEIKNFDPYESPHNADIKKRNLSTGEEETVAAVTVSDLGNHEITEWGYSYPGETNEYTIKCFDGKEYKGKGYSECYNNVFLGINNIDSEITIYDGKNEPKVVKNESIENVVGYAAGNIYYIDYSYTPDGEYVARRVSLKAE